MISLCIISSLHSRIVGLYAFQVADKSRMRILMDCLLEELFLAHGEACLDQVYTFAIGRAYCVNVSI